jgi:hypothetical protein
MLRLPWTMGMASKEAVHVVDTSGARWEGATQLSKLQFYEMTTV